MGQIKHLFKKVSFVFQSLTIKIKHIFLVFSLIKLQDLHNLARGSEAVQKARLLIFLLFRRIETL
jgi:hypothetical protein